jgi:hypothetical protein
MSAKADLVDRIKRRLGWPSVKIEVETETIYDHIDHAKERYIRFAVGNATQEVYFTMMLSANQYLYDMPAGTVDIIDYNFESMQLGGINTLFTVSNILYNAGLFGLLAPDTMGGFNLISYQIARDFLETLQRYTPDEYNFKYHSYTNQLEIQPPPLSGNILTLTDGDYDSPGFVLIHAFMNRCATLPGYTDDMLNADIYNTIWVEKYALALTKETLGYVRRKFAGFTGLGTQGTALDGEALVNEGKAEQEQLMVELHSLETFTGGYITMG